MKKSIVHGVLIIAAVFCLLLICWIAVLFGAIVPGEMPGSFMGAALGAAITGVITVILLMGQASVQEEKERAIKIFEKKLMVYSDFMEHLWGMFSDRGVTPEELAKLRNICFQQLVFFLNDKQIKSITDQLKTIADGIENEIAAAAQITFVLKDNLGLVAAESPKEKGKPGKNSLTDLFKSFEYKDVFIESKTAAAPSPELDSLQRSFDDKNVSPAYWHFTMYDERQIEALKNDNGKGDSILGLFEIGASWRTEYVRRVRPGDVVFLFRRGGFGYIGAFRAIGAKVLEWEEYEKNTEIYDERCDMYQGIADGIADYAANIIVRPLAFNCNGVGCKSPRRKTIEPINDTEAVNFLLTRFSGNELTEEQKAGINKFEADKPVNIQDSDRAFFRKLAETAIR
jgi:hypothetical protein